MPSSDYFSPPAPPQILLPLLHSSHTGFLVVVPRTTVGPLLLNCFCLEYPATRYLHSQLPYFLQKWHSERELTLVVYLKSHILHSKHINTSLYVMSPVFIFFSLGIYCLTMYLYMYVHILSLQQNASFISIDFFLPLLYVVYNNA